jgi:type I restriction enzyme S subunit
MGQGSEYIEGWTDRDDLVVRPDPAVVLYGGHTRRAKFVDFPFVPGPNVKILEPSRELIAKFLYHFLTQLEIESRGYADHFPEVRRRRVPVPPLPEQRRIAEILDKADALRATRRAAIAQLDTLTQSIFLDMSGDPATNPKGWAVNTLGELISVGPQNGLYKPASEYGSGTPILRIDGFYDGVVTGLTTLKRLRVTDEEQSLYGLHPGEIVINRVNSREYLGKSALIPFLSEPTVFESNMMRFAIDRTRLDPGYLIRFLQTQYVRGQILQSAKDAVNQSSINQQDVKGLSVLVPPLSTQQQFVQRWASIDQARANQTASLSLLAALFASLQHRAFRGEL